MLPASSRRCRERGGVLGAMETMYQRGKIQEESLYYETRSTTARCRSIGVNTFLAEPKATRSTRGAPDPLDRRGEAGSGRGGARVPARNVVAAPAALARLQRGAAGGGQRVRRVDGERQGLLARSKTTS